MNNHSKTDEKYAAELFGPLRDLEPDLETARGNRAAVREALRRPRRQTWLRRGIYVPLPAAALFLAAFVGMMFWQILSGSGATSDRKNQPELRQETRPQPVVTVASLKEPINYEHAVSVAGIGTISRVSGVISQEGWKP